MSIPNNIKHDYRSEVENYIQYLRNLIREDRVYSTENLETFIVNTAIEFIQQEDKLYSSPKSSENESKKTCEYCNDGTGCKNCDHFGFPCLNCAEYCYQFRLGPGHDSEKRT